MGSVGLHLFVQFRDNRGEELRERWEGEREGCPLQFSESPSSESRLHVILHTHTPASLFLFLIFFILMLFITCIIIKSTQ